MRMLVIYLIGINLLTFAIFGIDKWKARKRKWRIPEDTLIWLSIVGGSVGALLGMYLFRHKTQKRKFNLGIPADVKTMWYRFSRRADDYCIECSTDGNYMYEIIGSQMASPYLQLEIDEYGIGYTPYFYCTAMVRDLMRVDMLSIDGVAPTKESLRSNKYPFVSSIYAAVRKTENHESMAYKLYQFLFTKKGADMIDESGYIAIR